MDLPRSDGRTAKHVLAASAFASLHRLPAITGMLENDEVRKWKEQGARVVGYLCSTIPEEMSIWSSWSAGSAATTKRGYPRERFWIPAFAGMTPALHCLGI
jgi:hypothetical protein